MIVPLAEYATSKNYRKLWGLAHQASIICIVDYGGNCRDIAHTIYSPDLTTDNVQVSSRGISYIWAENLEQFEYLCANLNLEWLLPSSVFDTNFNTETVETSDGN